ncbi:MAG TPA: thermonuclease family protein [Acidiferrobacterales bacterium]|nr:thermonuclease family protein [Acidiferrobacterales bacterium]
MPFLVVLALLLPSLTAIAGTEGVTVRYVVDGDSVILSDQRQVRLIGINAPEFGKDGRPDEPLAAAARDRLRELVQGKHVRLVLEEEQRDHYGRWLAHLRLPDDTRVEEILVEEILLREGLAAAIAIPPNISQVRQLFAAESVARTTRRGIWGVAYTTPVPAESLTSADTGFRFVRGRVTHVGRSRKYMYLDLGPQFAVRIGHADWKQYFRGRPENWRGAQIEARGWISEQNGRLHLGIGHPAMLQRLP